MSLIKLASFESSVSVENEEGLDKEASEFISVLKRKIKSGELSGPALEDLTRYADHAGAWGKGRLNASADAGAFVGGHAAGAIDKVTGLPVSGTVKSKLEGLLAHAKTNKKLYAGGALLAGGAYGAKRLMDKKK